MAEPDCSNGRKGAVPRGAFIRCWNSFAKDGGVGSPKHRLGSSKDEAAIQSPFGCVGNSLVNFGGGGWGESDIRDHVVVNEILHGGFEAEGDEGNGTGEMKEEPRYLL